MKKKTKIKIIIAIIIVLGLSTFYSSVYVVDETEQVVITQFGKVVGDPIKEPGLKYKLPFIQKANYFENVLLEWDGDEGQIPTKDKKFIWVDTFARWKIVDPVNFFQSVNNKKAALQRLDEIIDPATRNLITSYHLIESVRNSNRLLNILDDEIAEKVASSESEKEEKVKNQKTSFEKYQRNEIKLGRDEITKHIVKQAKPKLKELGIDLVDVKIKRINYIEKVRRAVYKRMIAERDQIAAKYISEGRSKASEIRGEKQKILQKISSEAYEEAETLKGKADGKATRIYADAFKHAPEFYAFLKTLNVYRNTLDKDSTLVLSTNSDLMRYFKKGNVKD